VRPPSIPDLHRRSGSIPGEPCPPSKQIDCTAGAGSSKAKASILETKSGKSQGVWGTCVREDLMDLLIERNQLG
jgi:hypothetical protein